LTACTLYETLDVVGKKGQGTPFHLYQKLADFLRLSYTGLSRKTPSRETHLAKSLLIKPLQDFSLA